MLSINSQQDITHYTLGQNVLIYNDIFRLSTYFFSSAATRFFKSSSSARSLLVLAAGLLGSVFSVLVSFPCLAFCPLLTLAAAYAEITMLAIAIADTISSGVIFTSSSFVYGLVGL